MRSAPRTYVKAHRLLIWLTLTLDNKRPHLAVRQTYHFGGVLFIQWQRDDKQHNNVFGFVRLFSVFTTMFFPVGLSLAFSVSSWVSLIYIAGNVFLGLQLTMTFIIDLCFSIIVRKLSIFILQI